MSAEIKITAQTTPPAVVKVNGKCYSLAQAAVFGKPDTEISAITNSYATCAACKAAGDVPNTCPVGLESSYAIGLSTPAVAGCTASDYSGALWEAVVTVASSCVWSYIGGNERQFAKTESSLNYYRVGGSDASIYARAFLGLIASQYWYFYTWTGTCYGIWVKRSGVTPVGVYETIGYGVTDSNLSLTCRWITPTSITVAEVV